MWAILPLVLFWGHIPQTPCQGAPPPGPLCPPPWALGSPAFWGPLVAGLARVGYSPPLLVLWGGAPHNPPPGGFVPLDPRLPALVGFGFAGVLGPTRGWLTSPPAPPRSGKGRTPPNFPPSLAGKGVRGLGRKGGHPLRPPPWGLRPLDPLLPTLVGFGFARVLSLSEAEKEKLHQISPFPRKEGGQRVRSERHIPYIPCQGAKPPLPPL